MATIRWQYGDMIYTAGRISGGFGITTDEGCQVYSSYSADDVLAVARARFGYGR